MVSRALVISQLNYCNVLYMGLPICVLYMGYPSEAAAGEACRGEHSSPRMAHITPLWHELH